jgi:hypothetical protein
MQETTETIEKIANGKAAGDDYILGGKDRSTADILWSCEWLSATV